MEPEAIAARVWPGREVELEPLGGGITNRNFKVTVGGETFVLRIGGKDTALLGIDREAEHAATPIAADLEIGPEVVAFLQPEGSLVTRFVDGQPTTGGGDAPDRDPAARGRDAAEASTTAPPSPSRFDSFRVVEAYLATAASRGVATPREYERAKQTADEIERMRGPRPARPCHNDLLNANFIAPGRNHSNRRLGVRRHGRPLLRSRQLLGQPRVERRPERAAADGVLRRARGGRTCRRSA